MCPSYTLPMACLGEVPLFVYYSTYITPIASLGKLPLLIYYLDKNQCLASVQFYFVSPLYTLPMACPGEILLFVYYSTYITPIASLAKMPFLIYYLYKTDVLPRYSSTLCVLHTHYQWLAWVKYHFLCTTLLT